MLQVRIPEGAVVGSDCRIGDGVAVHEPEVRSRTSMSLLGEASVEMSEMDPDAVLV